MGLSPTIRVSNKGRVPHVSLLRCGMDRHKSSVSHLRDGLIVAKVRKRERFDSGVTLIELIIVIAIIGLLSTMAVPIAKFAVKREKERELRAALWEMRSAIDHYKDAADKGGIQTKTDSFNYPPDLETMVDGVEVQSKTVRFLREIPKDPMTGTTEWSLVAMQDDADSDSWGGQNVFNVHTKSTGTALDGSKYNTW